MPWTPCRHATKRHFTKGALLRGSYPHRYTVDSLLPGGRLKLYSHTYRVTFVISIRELTLPSATEEVFVPFCPKSQED